MNHEEVVVDRSAYSPEFRIRQDGTRNVPTIELVPAEGEPIVLQGKPLNRFLGFMDIRRRAFFRLSKFEKTSDSGRKTLVWGDRSKSQALLEAEYPKMKTKQFKLLYVNKAVARITSEKYISIPHKDVMRAIERRLEAENIKVKAKDVKLGGVCTRYTLDLPTEGNADENGRPFMDSAIWFVNSNSGDKSLRIYGGGVVQVCSNGMMMEKTRSSMRMLHKSAPEVVARKIDQQVGAILEKLTMMPEQLEKLRKQRLTKAQAKKRISLLPLPRYLQEAVEARLFESSTLTANGEMDWDGSMYGVYMAATYIASHADEVAKSRKSTKPMDEYMIQQLSKVENFSLNWAKREKELERQNAPRIARRGNPARNSRSRA